MAIFRSYLFAPGNHEELLRKVFATGADGVVLDLEDAVPPSQKARARGLIADVLRNPPVDGRPSVFVRINSLGGAFWEADVKAVVGPGLTGLRVAKAESVSDIHSLDDLLGTLETERGMS